MGGVLGLFPWEDISMFLATTNKKKKLLHISYIGRVDAEEIRHELKEIPALLEELPNGFTLVMDLERLDSMSLPSGQEIGKLMELCDKSGIEKVIRVIPDKKKDIGLQILYLMHYKHPPPVFVCERMKDVARLLEE